MDEPGTVRDPLTDPQPGDVVEIQAARVRYVTSRATRTVWFHEHIMGQWSSSVLHLPVNVWVAECKGATVVERGREDGE